MRPEPPASTPSVPPPAPRRWSAADPAWFLLLLLGFALVRLVAERVLGTRHAMTSALVLGPVAGVLLVGAYWRLRLRASWRVAVAMGLVVGGLLGVIGWLKGQF